jgi:hypothetical protein
MTQYLNSVIPTEVRPSVLGWSSGVEEPAVRSLRQTACKPMALPVPIAVFLFWLVGAASAQNTPAPAAGVQKELDTITTALVNQSVASVDILHMPDSIDTRASVTPENLKSWWDCRITISKVREWVGRNELEEAMKSTKVGPNSRMPDLRSAVIFYNSDGKRIGALYFGRYFGRYIGQFGGAEGGIGNTPVKFNGSLSTWLRQIVPPSLH